MDTLLNTHSLIIDQPLLRDIAAIDEFKGAWTALSRLPPERLQGLRRLATIASVGASTRIEGAQLSDAEVERLLAAVDDHPLVSRDEQEVAGCAAVMAMITSDHGHIELTVNHILQLHRDLLQYSDKDQRHRGAFKTQDNVIEAFDANGVSLGVVFEPVSAFETPAHMQALVDWTCTELDRAVWHPLIVVAVFVVVFLAIHPFTDGNGRLSRLLTHLLLLRAGYPHVAYASLERIIEASRDQYYLALRRTQRTLRDDQPNWQPWLSYFIGALQIQSAELAETARQEHRLMATSALSLQLLALVDRHGRLSVAEAVRLTGANRNTVKDHLRRLVERGALQQHGAGRGSWYGPS